jgi:alpha-tubulin suppressor-like RCC1 family protein
MINSQNLIDKICATINSGGLTALQICQTVGALDLLSAPVCSVSTLSALPNAVDYTGRMIYVNDENRYYYSFNGSWLNNFDSTPFNYVDLTFAWGRNCHSVLGDNSATNRSSPVSVVGAINWLTISAGFCHNLAVSINGSAWTWGGNTSGALGDNTTVGKSSPVSVVGGFTNWCQGSVGGSNFGQTHSVAVRSNGSAWAWGTNNRGQLGNNTNIQTSSPISVVGGFSDWCAIGAARYHTVAVRTNGSAWAWGYNTRGQLGNNTTTQRSSPVSVVGGFSDWCAISAANQQTAAVRTNGSIWSWGLNSYEGNLGDNTTVDKSSPVSVVGGFTNWCAVDAGEYHSVALNTSGNAWSWGRNDQGRLGDNTTTKRSSPVSVVGGFSNWCGVSAGFAHTLGIQTNGSAWGWGDNQYGRLGDGTVTSRSSPVSVVGGCSDWCQLSAGRYHSLGIRQVCKGF